MVKNINILPLGDIFCKGIEKGKISLCYYDIPIWLEQNWKDSININNDRSIVGYFLKNNPNDASIQEATGNPGFMNEETFILVFYLMLFQPELARLMLRISINEGYYYIFHVIVGGSKKIAITLSWNGMSWALKEESFNCEKFRYVYDEEIYLFVYFAITE